VSRNVRKGPGDRRPDDPRAGRAGLRAGSAAVALVGAALIAAALAGCGGGGTDSSEGSSSTIASGAAGGSSATTTTTSAGVENDAQEPAELGSSAAVRSVTERVLLSVDPADACGRYVTQHYLSTAYGGRQACVQAQRPGIAATSLSSFRIDSQHGGGRAVQASVVLHGGPYDGSTAKVGLRFEAGQYRVNALGANVPVGP